MIFDPKRNVQQNSLDADEDDRAWARDKAKDQGVSKKDVPKPGV